MSQPSGGGFMSTMGGQIRPDGSFTLSGVAPGEYTLRAQPMGPFGENPEYATVHVTVGAEDITGVQLAALKPVTVTGRIVVPAGASFQAATTRLVASPAEPDAMMFGPGGGGKINDDLTFELKVPPGRSLVRLLGSLPITPGGIGVVEVGLTTALVGFGGDNAEVVAAVLLYRFLSIVPTLLLGLAAGVIWRRLEPFDLGEPHA